MRTLFLRFVLLSCVPVWVAPAWAQAPGTTLRIMPPDRTTIAVGQRFDLRVEASGAGGQAPAGLKVSVDGADITSRNILAPGTGGERGAGGARDAGCGRRAARPGVGSAAELDELPAARLFLPEGRRSRFEAATADGARASVKSSSTLAGGGPAAAGRGPGAQHHLFPRRRHGYGSPHGRTHRVARLTGGRAIAPLAMDTLEITGQVMTSSLNAVVTDSAPGMSSYVTGRRPTTTRRACSRTTPPTTSTTPASSTSARSCAGREGRASTSGSSPPQTSPTRPRPPTPCTPRIAAPAAEIAARFFDERDRTASTVLMGGGARNFWPKALPSSVRADDRDLAAEFNAAGFTPRGRAPS